MSLKATMLNRRQNEYILKIYFIKILETAHYKYRKPIGLLLGDSRYGRFVRDQNRMQKKTFVHSFDCSDGFTSVHMCYI